MMFNSSLIIKNLFELKEDSGSYASIPLIRNSIFTYKIKFIPTAIKKRVETKYLKIYLNKMNSTAITKEVYNQNSPAECQTLRSIGYYLVILFVFSVFSNGKIIYMYSKNKSLSTPIKAMIFALTCMNLVGTLIEIPIIFINCFKCK
jgi:hypothetical protein